MRAGPLMGAYDIFEIIVTGKSAHAAMAYTGKPVLFAAHTINALQTIVARNSHRLDAGVVSVTQVHGGDTWNVIPQAVVLRGTVRAFKREVQDLIEQRMKAIVAGVATTFDMAATLRYERRYPATVNAAIETQHAIATVSAVVGAGQVDMVPTPEMGSEHFAFMLQQKPGC
jgi:amidohydrolase